MSNGNMTDFTNLHNLAKFLSDGNGGIDQAKLASWNNFVRAQQAKKAGRR